MISVIVCTYNRPELLKSCVDSLLAQCFDKEKYEIIIVDNGTSEETGALISSLYAGEAVIRYLREKRPGLSIARNSGWRAARGDHVAFLDDDAMASSDWLFCIEEVSRRWDADMIGGPIYPYYTTEKPAWFKDEYEIRVHQDHSGWMKDGFISGSNMVFKKKVLDELSGFDENYGMRGPYQAYGDETELLVRARRRGKRLYYSQKMMVRHHVPAVKMDILYAMGAAFRNGMTTYELWWEDIDIADVERFSSLVEGVFEKIRGAACDDRSQLAPYQYKENFIYERCLRDISVLGALIQYMKKKNSTPRFSRWRMVWDRIKRRGAKWVR